MLHEIKNFIKSKGLTQSIYSTLQAKTVEYQYKRIVQYYKSKVRKPTKREKIIIDHKPIVFYMGCDEMQDKSGFLQALGGITELSYFTKADGSYGSYSYGVLNRKKNILQNGDRLINLLGGMEKKPDLLLMQSWEWRIGLATLQKIKKLYPSMLIANIAMDDRHSYWVYFSKKIGSSGLIPALDHVFTTSLEAVSWYEKEGCTASFFPLASDTEIFHPLSIPRIYDVGFVGAKYGVREEIIQHLTSEGINVKAYGNGWRDGRLPLSDTNKFYNQCEIVLGVGTILGSENFTSMKLRDFDVPMSGSVYITHKNSDTEEIFTEGKEAYYYETSSECADLVKKLLSDEIDLSEVRACTLTKALDHTYIKRVKEMLTQLNFNT